MNKVDDRGPIELPNYRFRRLLNRGGMGGVYLAEQINPAREVAIKVIAPDDLPRADPEVLESILAMLQDEGHVAARFNHENLITVHECGVVNGHYYLVMEYLPGGSLRERLGSGLDPNEACAIVARIARGLSEMHAEGLLHRDIKPENILFRKNGNPVLMDYGVAKHAGTISKLTQWGLSTGTPEYMSPEQVDEHPVDARSDLYALGVLLYELLTGEVPFRGRTAMAIGFAHVHHPIPRLPDHLAEHQSLIDRLLAKDPADRFQDAGEVIEALGGAGPGVASPTRVTPAGAQRPRVTVFGELKRRKVLHTAAVYGVTAFGAIEILSFVFENFSAPPSLNRWLASAFVAGFPIAMFLSWAFDIEPGGQIRRTRFQGQSTWPIIAGSMVLLVAATAGLDLLLRPDPTDEANQPKPGAHDQVVLGRQQYSLRTAESLLAAERHFQRATEIDPDYAAAYVGLADTYAWLPEYADSDEKDYEALGLAMANQALALDPDSGEAHAARARYYPPDRAAEAEDRYRRATDLSPEVAHIRYEYGTFLMSQGRLEEAVEQRRIATELDPLTPLYAWGEASMLAEAGRIQQALALLRANIRRFPDFQPNYERIQYLLLRRGQLGEAQLYARRYRMRNPRVAANWAEECRGYLHLDDPASTQACLEGFATAHPDHPDYHDTRAYLLRYRGEYDELLDVRRMLWQQDPGNGLRVSQLAEILDWQGEYEAALKLMSDAFPRMLADGLELPPEPNLIVRAAIFATILHDNGVIDRRDALIEAIERRIGQMPPWSFGIVEVLIEAMRENPSQAVAALRTAIDSGWKQYWWTHRRNPFLKRQGVQNHPEFVTLMDGLTPVVDEQRQWFEANKDRFQ